MLKLNSFKGEATQLQQLGWVEGRSIGSALIDMNFHQIAVSRLDKIRASLRGEPDMIADRMVHGRFERIKCSYGTAASSALPTIPIEVPDLEPGYDAPEARIEDAKMIIERDELKSLFDVQVNKMLSVIDEQFDRMQQNHPSTQIVGSPQALMLVSILTY